MIKKIKWNTAMHSGGRLPAHEWLSRIYRTVTRSLTIDSQPVKSNGRHLCQNTGRDRLSTQDLLAEMDDIHRNVATISVQRVARSLRNYITFVDDLQSVNGQVHAAPHSRDEILGQINVQVMRIVDRFIHHGKPLVDHSLRANVLSILSFNLHVGKAFEILYKSAQAGFVKARDFRALLRYNSNIEVTAFILYNAKKLGVFFTDDDFVYFLEKVSRSSLTNAAKHTILRQIESTTERVNAVLLDLLQLYRQPFSPVIFHQRLKLSATSSTPGIGLLAICPRCNGHLSRFPYRSTLQDKLLQGILQYATEKCRERKLNAEIQTFLHVVREKQMDVVLDGANIGYCGLDRSGDCESELSVVPFKDRPHQPRSNSFSPVAHHLWLEHIDAVVHAVRAKNLRPVIMLHRRHVERGRLWDKYRRMVERWRKDEILLCTPDGVEDDLFWLYALLYHSRPNKRMFIVTNDLGRDHLFALGVQKDLQLFFQECKVKFKILPPGTLAILDFPVPFSVYPQFSDSTCRWHIPIRECDAGRWECCSVVFPGKS